MSDIRSVANIDGVIKATADACIPVLDRGFLYGDSVYEVFRTYSGVPLFFDEHFARLDNSARLIGMHITQSRERLTEQIRRTVQASGATASDDVYVRYQITRGMGPIDLFPDPGLPTRYVIIVKELSPWKPELYSEGLTMAIPRVRRNPVNALDPNIKGGNYLNNILAVTEARELGANDCVILDSEGFVTEAANSNVWFVINGNLVTPGSGNLRGLTKNALHKALSRAGVDSNERDVRAAELPDASECFVSSTTREVMPVRSLRLENGDTIEFPAGGGVLTRRARESYKAYVDDYVRRHADLCLV